MTRKEITYRELLSEVSASLKRKADEAGKKLDVKTISKATSERWKKVKSGDDKEFIHEGERHILLTQDAVVCKLEDV